MIAKEDLVAGAKFKLVDAFDQDFYKPADIETLSNSKYEKELGKEVTIKRFEFVDGEEVAHIYVHENELTWFIYDLEPLCLEEIEIDSACAMSALFGLA